MKHLSRLTLVFAAAFAFFLLVPPFLSRPFGPFPLMKNGDVLDLLTPVVLMPLYWLLFLVKRGDEAQPSLAEQIAFTALAAVWVLGQGIHLGANSIGHLTGSVPDSDVAALTHFYDEVLGHYLWHFGIIALSALLLLRQWRNPFAGERPHLVLTSAAGILYGIPCFTAGIEGGTVSLFFPFSMAVVAVTLIWGRGKLRQQPLLAFFFVGYLLATVLFAAWGLYWGGFPQFSELGWVKLTG